MAVVIQYQMQTPWPTFAIYLDGKLRFPRANFTALSNSALLERIQFVHDAIEFCFGEGRMMDLRIFYQLEDMTEKQRRGSDVTTSELLELSSRMADLYGLQPESDSTNAWIKTDSDGHPCVSIDQQLIVMESSRRLFRR